MHDIRQTKWDEKLLTKEIKLTNRKNIKGVLTILNISISYKKKSAIFNIIGRLIEIFS